MKPKYVMRIDKIEVETLSGKKFDDTAVYLGSKVHIDFTFASDKEIEDFLTQIRAYAERPYIET